MKLRIGSSIFDTSDMRVFKTGNPEEPIIYLDQNCRVFIVGRCQAGEGLVRRALTPEITVLAERYGIAELARALHRRPVR
jgi:hypothetical protein